MKGVAKSVTNIKATVSGQTPAFTQLQVGQYAFGTLSGTAVGGDLVGFSHIYLAGGTKVELGCVCKAFAGNLTLTNEAEPDGTTPPPPPVAGPVTAHVELDDNGTHYAGDVALVKQ